MSRTYTKPVNERKYASYDKDVMGKSSEGNKERRPNNEKGFVEIRDSFGYSFTAE